MVKEMKTIDWYEADGVKQKVCSRDEVINIGMSDMRFSKRSWMKGEQG